MTESSRFHYRWFILVIAALLLGLASFWHNSTRDRIDLTITPLLSTISKGNSVEIQLKLTNYSDSERYINRHIYFSHFPKIEYEPSSIALIGNSPSGQQPPKTCKINPALSPSALYLLLPGESYTKVIDLADCYGFDEIGIYQLQLFYGNSYSPEGFDNVWIGVIESNTIEVEIIP